LKKNKWKVFFFSLKDEGVKEVFIRPDEGILERHVSESAHPVIIKPFINLGNNRDIRCLVNDIRHEIHCLFSK
ncbi:MAG: hypothetical protein ACRDE2_16455, partial [Chitinophagaceae bacterium]